MLSFVRISELESSLWPILTHQVDVWASSPANPQSFLSSFVVVQTPVLQSPWPTKLSVVHTELHWVDLWWAGSCPQISLDTAKVIKWPPGNEPSQLTNNQRIRIQLSHLWFEQCRGNFPISEGHVELMETQFYNTNQLPKPKTQKLVPSIYIFHTNLLLAWQSWTILRIGSICTHSIIPCHFQN